MVEVLYRKYRPRDFDEIFGQDTIKQTLSLAIREGKVAHAYLFSGPRGTGKTSMARIFAKRVNKLNDRTDKKYLDIIEIDAASNRGIEEIRELRQRINFVPSSLTYKVYIIDEVHMLTKEAFNALLKTLEEPPSYVIFILATTEVNKVPITVLSRTQRFDFKLALEVEIIKKVKNILTAESIHISDEGINLIVSLGRGSFRDTETILEKVLHSTTLTDIPTKEVQNILGLTSLDLIDKFIDGILKRDFLSAFSVVKQVEDSGININYFYSQILENFRKLLIKSQLSSLEIGITRSELVKIITIFIESSGQVRYSPIEILTLEIALTKIRTLLGDINTNLKDIGEVGDTSNIRVIPRRASKFGPNIKKIVKNEVTIKPSSKKPSKMTLQSIKNIWKDLLEKVKVDNGPLVAFLRQSKVFSLEGENLIIKVGYKFHKTRIESQKSKLLIENILQTMVGRKLLLKCIIDNSLKPEQGRGPKVASNSDMVEEIFGK